MVNYLMSPTYQALVPPSPFIGYGNTKSPVTCTAGCAYVQLNSCDPSTIALAVSSGCIVIGYSAATSNNPAGTVNANAAGTLAVNASGSTTNAAAGTVTYAAAAILMSIRSVTPYGALPTVIQTWQIISDGTVPPSTAAIVEVSSSLEREFGPAETFTVFATGTGCSAIDLGGTVTTESYDGSSIFDSGGNLGTNGNLSIGGHVTVHGSLSSPRTGVGTCVDGQSVTALTEGGSASVDGNNVIQLPQAMTFPAPSPPSPLPPVANMSPSGTTCTQITNTYNLANVGTTCVYDSGTGTATITPGNPNIPIKLGNLTGNWVLGTGNYNVNSIGSGNLSIPSAAGSVTLNLAGRNSDGTQMSNPFNLNGQAVVNNTMDASKLQVLYAGTGTIDLTGGSSANMLLYAPNASVVTHGNADIYGSLLVAHITSGGTPRFIYDNRLEKKIVTLGNYMLTSFSWKKY
jgi:hypothetical protein